MKYFFCLILSFSLYAKEKVDSSTVAKMINALKANESLHASFFQYDPKKIEQDSKLVLSGLKKVNHEKLDKDIKRTISYLEKIKASASRDDNNKNYHLASSFLIKLINKYDFGPKYQAYYCPMVRKKWVQNVEEKSRVHNPYDPSMPHCGGRL